jgi:hypothetical protein
LISYVSNTRGGKEKKRKEKKKSLEGYQGGS